MRSLLIASLLGIWLSGCYFMGQQSAQQVLDLAEECHATGGTMEDHGDRWLCAHYIADEAESIEV